MPEPSRRGSTGSTLARAEKTDRTLRPLERPSRQSPLEGSLGAYQPTPRALSRCAGDSAVRRKGFEPSTSPLAGWARYPGCATPVLPMRQSTDPLLSWRLGRGGSARRKQLCNEGLGRGTTASDRCVKREAARLVLFPCRPPSSGGARACSRSPGARRRAASPAGACLRELPESSVLRLAHSLEVGVVHRLATVPLERLPETVRAGSRVLRLPALEVHPDIFPPIRPVVKAPPPRRQTSPGRFPQGYRAASPARPTRAYSRAASCLQGCSSGAFPS